MYPSLLDALTTSQLQLPLWLSLVVLVMISTTRDSPSTGTEPSQLTNLTLLCATSWREGQWTPTGCVIVPRLHGEP